MITIIKIRQGCHRKNNDAKQFEPGICLQQKRNKNRHKQNPQRGQLVWYGQILVFQCLLDL
jgi:hypothetical protein